MKVWYSFLIFISVVFNTQFVYPQWVQTNGPGEGWIDQLTASGSYIIASSLTDGVYLSTNNGTNWTPVNNGLTNNNISSFAFSGTNIFAGTYGGVFITTNSGTSWAQTNYGLVNDTVYALIVNGTNIFAGTAGGVFLSTDNGSTWEQINNGLTNTTVNTFAVDGSNLFAGTSGGVYLSTDNGTNWVPANNGLAGNVTSLTISGYNVFAVATGGVFFSTDNGANWTQTSLPGHGDPTNLAVIGSNIFIGYFRPPGSGDVYRSTNNGIDWERVMGKGSVTAIAASGNNLYASVDDVQDFYMASGIFLSTDYGTNWTSVGLPVSTVLSLAVSGNNIFAGTDFGGVFLSTNKDGTGMNQVGLPTEIIRSLAISGTNIFAGTSNADGFPEVYLSTDNGTTWKAVLTDKIWTIAVRDANVFAGTYYDGVYLSTDNGTSWTLINNGLTNYAVHSFTISGTNIFAGTEGGVFLSTNDGTNWTQENNGLTDTTIYSLAINGDNIFAGTPSGVYRSTNNGSEWTLMNNGLINTDVRSFASSGGNIFSGTNGGGVCISTDNGALWTPIGLDKYSVLSIAVNETNVIAGTDGAGVWYFPLAEMVLPVELVSFTASAGNGDVLLKWNTATELYNMGFYVERSSDKSNWVQVSFIRGNGNSNSAKNYSYADKSISKAGKYYYRLKQVDNNGSYKYSNIVEADFNAPSTFALNQNYPNPFNPSTKISFSIKNKGFVKLNVYGIKGDLVKVLVNETKEAGYYETMFDGKGLASGVYIYRIEVMGDGNKLAYSDIKKTVLLK